MTCNATSYDWNLGAGFSEFMSKHGRVCIWCEEIAMNERKASFTIEKVGPRRNRKPYDYMEDMQKHVAYLSILHSELMHAIRVAGWRKLPNRSRGDA